MIDAHRLASSQTMGSYVVLSTAKQVVRERQRPDPLVTLLADGESVDPAMEAVRRAHPKDAL